MRVSNRVRNRVEDARERISSGYEGIYGQVKDAKYVQEFRDSEFWSKLKKFARKAGSKLTYIALMLFYTLKKPSTPKWAKAAIAGAIAYFIIPIDAVADFLPVVGLTDDLGVLTAALFSVAAYVDDEVKEEAKEKLYQWFGEEEEEGEHLVHVIQIDQQLAKEQSEDEGLAAEEDV